MTAFFGGRVRFVRTDAKSSVNDWNAMTGKRRIILADDHAILRAGLRNLISESADFQVVAEAADGESLLGKLRTIPCDLVIMDISMPKLNGLQTLEQLKKQYPALKVLILSMHKERDYIKNAMTSGADGYVFKDTAFEKLLTSLRDIFAGQKAFSAETMTVILDEYVQIRESHTTLDELTKREREIFRALVRGKTNKEIAAQLDISARTVEGHRANLMEKLNVKNMAELIKTALSLGIS